MKKQLLSILCLALLPVLAPAQTADAKARPDVDELITVMRIEKMFGPMMEQIKAQTKATTASMLKQNGLSADATTKSNAMQDKMFAAIQDEMAPDKLRAAFIKIYSETFTPDEIKAITAFYKGPAGQAFLDKQPLLMQKTMAWSQGLMADIMPKMQAIIKEEAGSAAKEGKTPAKTGDSK